MLFKVVPRVGRVLAVSLMPIIPCNLQADPGPLSISFNYPGVPGLEVTGNATDNKSWYTTGLPIGNGKLAAMVFGGVSMELIQFNEDTIWCGQPHDYTNPNTTPAALANIRAKCFNGQDISTEATTYLLSVPSRLPVYECPGALRLTFPHSGVSNYLRSLNLSNATVNVSYTYNGVRYNREIFASAPSNRVIVVRFTASQPSSITFSCSFTNLQTATNQSVLLGSGKADLVMHARVTFNGDYRYYVTGLTNLVYYDARVRLVATGGNVTTGANSISVTNADEVTLFLSVVSNVKAYNDLTADYVTICSNNVANADALGYAALRQAQQQDYTNLFNRVVLDLGHNPFKTNDLGFRKKQIGADPNDPNLITLFFQLGRYLMISGSRPGSQPLNLQGKWNDRHNLYSGWGSKMTLNINEEMNYWGAEVANLSECHEPLFDLIKDLSETGRKVALSNYFCSSTNAWVAHHNTDLWRNAGPVNNVDGIWPTGGAWLCQHLWWHYEYTGDTNWLASTAYPLMKGAAAFFQDYLVTHPTNANWKVTCPSHSPEHADPGGHANCPSPTMDNELIRDLFDHVIAASEILNVDGPLRTNLMNLRRQIPPDMVGNAGQLREFLNYDDSTYDLQHRHCSHLVGLFPGDQISLFYTPHLAAAAKVSVDLRGLPLDTPWSMAWRMNLRNRLLDGEGAFRCLTNLLAYSKVSTNLMFGDNTDGAWRQVDFIFGSLSGIAEMFLQSHLREIFLLPALPPVFTNGSVSGLCARGGFQVDIQWQSNKLVSANILSKLGNTCRVRSKWPIEVKLGTNYLTAQMVLPGLWEFPTEPGRTYTIELANIAEAENSPVNTSPGDTHQTVTNAVFSNLRGVALNANAAGDYIMFTVPNIRAGNYRVIVAANAGPDRGMFQLACGPINGSLTNVGPVQDTYCATNVVYFLPIKLGTSTNQYLFWTNMLREFDCGTWAADSDGTYQFKFIVVDKNPASGGYGLVIDYIKLTPALAQAPPANSSPADILLSNATVAENEPPGTVVGTFSTADPDPEDSFTYNLVEGPGDTDNDFFVVTNAALLTAAAFDYEAKQTYSIRVRSTDRGGLWIEKTFTISVTDVNEPPEAPTNVAPVDGATDQPLTPTLVSSAFADPDSGDAHLASQWIVRQAANEQVVFNSGEDSTNKTSIVLPPGALAHGTTYNWQVRYKDTGGAWSGFSAPTVFTTVAPTLTASVQQGALALSWPTNISGFVLECATELSAPSWELVLAPVTIVDGQYRILLPMTNLQTFYRLHRP